jgi:hypothetical protein
MRKARSIVAGAGLALSVIAPASAAADPVDEFDACLTSSTAAECGDNVSYFYGDVVVLKGTVSPAHQRAVVQRRAPGSDRWVKVDTVTITDHGRMKWRWHTHRGDADQAHPYRLRFRIPGHGTSHVAKAWVLFGE